jgi:hypothetical protein
MYVVERIVVAAGMLWAAAWLGAQLLAARGAGRRDYSARAGSPGRAVLYNFTTAMTPSHKETIRHHPFKFAVGLVMHAGVAAALFELLVLLVWPQRPLGFPLAASVAALALAAGSYLLVRRAVAKNLRLMSCPDDYLSALVTCGLVAAAALYGFGVIGASPFLIVAAAVFFYLPLGKLRHVLYCPLSRLELGLRLGYRGTYPPARPARS